MDAPWQIELLGRLRAVHDGREVTRFRSQQTGGLLAYLAHTAGRPHPREELIELLWPECDLEAGRNRLRVALSSLRGQLEPPGIPGGAVLVADRATVQLSPDAVTTDVAAFEAALSAARRAGGSAERVARLSEAAELYRGELLPGFFEAWVFPERQRLSEQYFHAVRTLIRHHQQAGGIAEALSWARRAVSADPLREEAHHELIRLLAASGQKEAALRQYRDLVRLLDEQLGDRPSRETEALARQIEQQNARTAGPLPASTGLTTDNAAVGGSSARLSARLPSPDPEASLPTGTVTFLMTDVERSTAQWERTGDAFTTALDAHHALLRSHFVRCGGREVKELGEGFLVAFSRAVDALRCSVAAQQALASFDWPESVGPLRVRMALHTGDVQLQEDDYHSLVLHHGQRILETGHGGQILCSETTATLLRRQLPPDAQLTDLGIFRLRDVSAPERLFQVSAPGLQPSVFPPLRAESGYAGRLPLQFTRFFGREAELQQLAALLEPPSETAPEWTRSPSAPAPLPPTPQRPGDAFPPLDSACRLVTLTGPGGTGKTRLAMAAAARLGPSWSGAVWFVPLADLMEAALIPDKILESLRLPRAPRIEPMEQVVAFLERQPSLLVFDNFEHLLAEGIPHLRTLLQRAPTLTCLVTSRQRLGLPGERELPVPPLDVPVSGNDAAAVSPAPLDERDLSPQRLLDYASVRLFVDRAQAARPDFQLTRSNAGTVAALCQRLEGLPLAIELAAARARLLTPAQMLARLEQRFDLLVSRQREPDSRHRSLRAAFDSSYQLLAPELQRFFARLSVFRGSFTLDAAEQVCQEPSALDYLEQLRESSLLLAEETVSPASPTPGAEATEMCFRLLETLRDYAAEQLDAGEREPLRRRHASYYVSLVKSAEPALLGHEQPVWAARLEREYDNLRAVLDWSAEPHDDASDAPEGPPPVELGLRLGGALYWYWTVHGYMAEGRERLARLLALPAAAHAPARARACACCGVLAHFQSDLAAARTAYTESLALGRAADDRWVIALSLTGLGFLAHFQADAPAARGFLDVCLPIWRDLGDRWGISLALNGLADVAAATGEMEPARSLFLESLAIRRDLGDRWGEAVSLSGLGSVALQQGQLDSARSLYGESLAIRQSLGDQWGIAVSFRNLGHCALRAGDLQAARSLLEKSLAIRHRIDDKRGIAECLEGLAAVLAALQLPERATLLLAAAAALRDQHQYPHITGDRAAHESQLAALRRELRDPSFEAAWHRGRAMTWQQAVALVPAPDETLPHPS